MSNWFCIHHTSISLFIFVKFKHPIWTAQYNIHIKMYLDAKFYIFYKKKIILFKIDTKSLFLEDFGPLKNSDFVPL